MITFTKEQLIASAHARIEFAEMMLAGELEPLKERTWSIELELARIALASLEAEPVAYMYKDNLHADARFSLHTRFGNWSQEDINEYEITEIPLYTAPPAPVSVPDVPFDENSPYDVPCRMPSNLRELIAEEIGILFSDDDAQSVWDVCRRAAMLHGAEPVQGWIPCSERMPTPKTGVMVGCWFGREWAVKWATYLPYHPYAHQSGFLMPGGSWTPTHWMPLPAAPQQEA